MKALTIEQIKQLKMGDWVYCVDMFYDTCGYIRLGENDMCYGYLDFELLAGYHRYYLSGYGKKWLAYRNKEEAECEGVLVELPCKVGDIACRFGRKSSGEIFIIEGKCIKIEMNKKGILIYFNTLTNWYYDEMDIGDLTDGYIDLSAIYFCTKEQAEQKLKELQENNE